MPSRWREPPMLGEVADHVDHIAKFVGVDHVGIGSDYDSVDNSLPEGLKGLNGCPRLLAELMRQGWSDADIAKLVGGNIFRVMAAAERDAAWMAGQPTSTTTGSASDRAGALAKPT